MFLRLAYLGITNVFALLRLMPGSHRDKNAEILSLRHQLAVLQRQLGEQRVRFEPADRAPLAALLHHLLPRPSLHGLRLLVRPDTILRWHVTSSHAATRRRSGLGCGADRGPCARSAPWCCASRPRTRRGPTGGCTGTAHPAQESSEPEDRAPAAGCRIGEARGKVHWSPTRVRSGSPGRAGDPHRATSAFESARSLPCSSLDAN